MPDQHGHKNAQRRRRDNQAQDRQWLGPLLALIDKETQFDSSDKGSENQRDHHPTFEVSWFALGRRIDRGLRIILRVSFSFNLDFVDNDSPSLRLFDCLFLRISFHDKQRAPANSAQDSVTGFLFTKHVVSHHFSPSWIDDMSPKCDLADRRMLLVGWFNTDCGTENNPAHSPCQSTRPRLSFAFTRVPRATS